MFKFKCSVNDEMARNLMKCLIDPCDICIFRINCIIDAYKGIEEDLGFITPDEYFELVNELKENSYILQEVKFIIKRG